MAHDVRTGECGGGSMSSHRSLSSAGGGGIMRVMSTRSYGKTAGVIFGIATVVHLARLIFGWDAVIAGWDVPVWVSVVAAIVAGVLSYQGIRLSKRSAAEREEVTRIAR